MGIDMGTTHIKVATFDLDGNLRTLGRRRTPTISNELGRGEYDPGELWNILVTLFQETNAQLDCGELIRSIAVSSMAEAGLLLDRSGRPLTPVISWFDSRGKEVSDEWFQAVGAERFFNITGLNANHVYSILKILWLKHRQPNLFEQADKWLCMPDFVCYCLTGVCATDFSIASRTGLFDINTKSWSAPLLEIAGLNPNLLPAVAVSGTLIGYVTEEVAARTGLREGIPVSLGGHDHVCGALAANAVRPQSVFNSMGTSESVIAIFEDLPPLDWERFDTFNVGCHVIDKTYYIQGGASSNGISVEWYLDTFGGADKLSYSDIVTLAKGSPPGARGLIFVPHLRGGGPPRRDPRSAGSFLGLREYHTRQDFARSIHEGISLETTRIIDGMASVLGLEFESIMATGGGTYNELWMSIKSTLAQKVVEVPAVQETSLLGAAILGGVGAGVYNHHNEAIQTMYKVQRRYQPDSDLIEVYAWLYSKYREIFPLMAQIGTILQEG